jgi:type I restriction enzyme S subunit
MVTETEVPKGYKKTEVGVIPKDWDVKILGELAQIISGGTPSTSQNEYWDGDINWCTPTDITSTKDKYLYKTERTITELGLKRSSARLLPEGVILLCSRATIGEVKISKVPIATNQGFKSLVAFQDINNEFLYYKILTLKNALVEKAIGSTFLEISKKDTFSLLISLPKSQHEQSLIAEVLSDIDSLISSLEELIKKKRKIKQGAMQELLTGKRRLPGFEGEWEEMKLGNISKIKTGKKNNEDKVVEGLYPFFVRSQTVERINTYSFDGEAILVPGEGGIGSIFHYVNGKFDYHQRVYKISDFDEDVCGKFIYYCMLQTFNKQAMRNSVKATVDSLRLPTFIEFEFIAPSFDEQSAIAQVLSEMDSEIEALEQKLDKYKMIKQGMMQELLTGKTRLVAQK